MQKLVAALGGISGILVTPFDAEDRLAPKRLAPIVDRAVRAGVHVLVVGGNTGEFYSLATDEAVAMVEAAAGHVAGRAPLLCGVGRALCCAWIARISCVKVRSSARTSIAPSACSERSAGFRAGGWGTVVSKIAGCGLFGCAFATGAAAAGVGMAGAWALPTSRLGLGAGRLAGVS